MNLTINRCNVARNIQIKIVLLNFLIRYHTGIMWHINLSLPRIDDTADIAFAQTVLRTILSKSFFCINHKNTLRRKSTSLVENDDTSRDSCPKEKIRRKTDNAAYDTSTDDKSTYLALSIAAEENSVRENDCAFAVRFKRCNHVEKKRIVATFRRRYRSNPIAHAPTTKWIVFRGTLHPTLYRKRRICKAVIKCL